MKIQNVRSLLMLGIIFCTQIAQGERYPENIIALPIAYYQKLAEVDPSAYVQLKDYTAKFYRPTQSYVINMERTDDHTTLALDSGKIVEIPNDNVPYDVVDNITSEKLKVAIIGRNPHKPAGAFSIEGFANYLAAISELSSKLYC